MNKYTLGPVLACCCLVAAVFYFMFRSHAANTLPADLKNQMQLTVNTDEAKHTETINIFKAARQKFNRLIVNYVDEGGTGNILDVRFCGVGPYDPPCPKQASSSSSAK